jgi:hypothetical protein
MFTGDKNKSTLGSIPASMAGHAEAKEMDVDEHVYGR